MIIVIDGIAAIVILGGIFAYGNTNLRQTQSTNVDSGSNSIKVDKLAFSSLVELGSPVRGDPTAPITLVEFGDFQCPNCARFAKDVEPQLEQEYFATGKVKMVFKHLPIRGPDSVTASIASQCAGDQGKFWEYYDILYASQRAENSGWANMDNLKGFASQLNLNQNEFDSCLDGEKYRLLVDEDFALAREVGVTGTPSFVIVGTDGSNPEGILGAQPYSSFKAVLDNRI